MRNKRFFIVLAGALIFGLLAAVSVTRYLSSAQAYTKNLTKVAVAKVAIPLGSKIIPEQIMVVQFPKESTPDGAFDSPEKLAGRVAVMNIAAREPITESRLAPEGTAAGLSAVIPEGYRAMNIKVLANGQNIDKPKDEREATSVKAVTLQVTPEQAEKLALATSEGKLQLVMRNQIDQGDEQTPGVNKRTLLSGEAAVPAPEPGSLKSEQPKQQASAKPVRRSAPVAKPADA